MLLCAFGLHESCDFLLVLDLFVEILFLICRLISRTNFVGKAIFFREMEDVWFLVQFPEDSRRRLISVLLLRWEDFFLKLCKEGLSIWRWYTILVNSRSWRFLYWRSKSWASLLRCRSGSSYLSMRSDWVIGLVTSKIYCFSFWRATKRMFIEWQLFRGVTTATATLTILRLTYLLVEILIYLFESPSKLNVREFFFSGTALTVWAALYLLEIFLRHLYSLFEMIWCL